MGGGRSKGSLVGDHQSLIDEEGLSLEGGADEPKPSKSMWNSMPVAAAVPKNASARPLRVEGEDALVVMGWGIGGDDASRGNSWYDILEGIVVA